ncbi:MAG: hypothetical protein HY702_08330 [Gemmatimonadetes bacterium]|nr:hypothetical protein [Gemmatimonadota bacterium]
MDRPRLGFLLALLSLVALAVVVVAVESPGLRLGLMLLLAVPGYLGAYLILQPLLPRKPKVERRKFFALRETTDRFIEEVRRLNALHVALASGERAPETAAAEIEAIQRRMHELVDEIRGAAGRVTVPSAGGQAANRPLQ